MAGVIGVVGKIQDTYKGLHYLQHRAQKYAGLASSDGEKLEIFTHKGKVKDSFLDEEMDALKGIYSVGCVSGDRQPVSVYSSTGGLILGYDGNLVNYSQLRDDLLKEGATFTGFCNPKDVKNINLISKIISREVSFEKGIMELVKDVQGDFAITCLAKDGIYATRGWGRKPLILGKKNGSYMVSSESSSFINTGFEIERDVNPGEIVFLNREGIHSVSQLDLSPIKLGTFEWIYTAYPTSIIDGKSVSEFRKDMGRLLARKHPVNADIVSPVPNSGRWHAIGYAEESGIHYEESFLRYDYSDRSFIPGIQEERDEMAQWKLIPVSSSIKGKKIVLVDDSIVRGTQTLNQVEKLRNLGVKEVHVRIACPPLMCACEYGDTTKRDDDCIAKRMSVDKIQERLKLDSLKYATPEMLSEASGYPLEKLCLSCWDLK